MTEKTVTRADLCEAVYQKIGLSRTESASLVELVLKEITDCLERGGLGSRQADLLIDGLAQIGTSDGLLGHRQPQSARNLLKFKDMDLNAQVSIGESICNRCGLEESRQA